MDDSVRGTPRSETKYGDRLADRDDVFPTECVFCDFSGENNAEYEQHMLEAHDL